MSRIDDQFLQKLRELVNMSSSMIQEKDMDKLLARMAEIARKYCGFSRVAISLLDENFLVYSSGATGLSQEAEQSLHQKSLTPEERRSIFQEKYLIGDSYYIPGNNTPWGDRGVASDFKQVEEGGWHSEDFMFTPIMGQEGEILGLVSVDDPEDGKVPDRRSLVPIEMLANIAASAVQNAALWQNYKTQLEQIQEINLELNSLQRTTADLLTSLDLEAVLPRIADSVVKGLGYTAAVVLDYSAEDNSLTVKAVAGDTSLLNLLEEIVGSPVIGRCFAFDPDSDNKVVQMFVKGELFCTDNLADVLFPKLSRDLARTIQKLFGLNAMASVPLVSDGALQGNLFAASRKFRLNRADTESLQAFANQAGIAIRNASLFKKEQIRAKELSLLNEISNRLSEHLERETTCVIALQAAKESLGAVSGAIHLIDDGVLDLVHTENLSAKTVKHLASKNVLKKLEVEISGNKTLRELSTKSSMAIEPYKMIIVLPLMGKRDSSGCCTLFFDEKVEKPSLRDDFLFALGRSIGAAIENASLFSELKSAYADLENTQEQLIQTEKLTALGELAGGIAHDFNNILSAILGRAQLLQQQTDDSTVITGLKLVEKAAFDGGETVRRIQEFTRVRTEKRFDAVDIIGIVKDSIEMARPRWKDEAERKGISYAIQSDFGEVDRVMGNSSELREVFSNIFLNAIDAMPQGGTIFVKTEQIEGEVATTIKDTGVGMTPEIKRCIFDPFYTTKGSRGTGLGMSVAYGIIQRHNGVIDIESELGEGAAFTLKLPAVPPGDVPVKSKKVEKEMSRLTGRILVIDDEDFIGEIVSDTLIEAGCEVRAVTDPREGIDIYSRDEYDMLITDLGMPVLSGWDVAERIRLKDADSVILLLTGWGGTIDEKEERRNSVDAILGKPFNMDALLKSVRECLALREERLSATSSSKS